MPTLQQKLDLIRANILLDMRSPTYVVALWGYLFALSDRDPTSDMYLYLNLQFDEHLVIKRQIEAGVPAPYVAHCDLFSELYPLAGTIVWVRGAATLEYVSAKTSGGSTQVQLVPELPATTAANMLQGSILQQYKQGNMFLPPLPMAPSAKSLAANSHAGCGTGSNTPGCPYRPDTTTLPDCPPNS